MSFDRDESSKVLLDPFMEPEPSQETGPGSHFRSTFDQPTPEPSPPPYEAVRDQKTFSSTNPFRSGTSSSRRSRASSVGQTSSKYGVLTPPASASPGTTEFPGPSKRDSRHRHTSSVPTAQHTRTRSTSLNERYPGDHSHQPLDVIRKESKRAQRSPHLNKRQLQGPDAIDRLDITSRGFYHHEGPYDAASFARNSNWNTSPLAAVHRGNQETLKATPRENVMDSIRRHRPLDGVGIVPSGSTDRFGRKYEYEEGPNLMIEGMYKRWPGIEYKDEDIKGKGEPSYSIDKALKQHKLQKNDIEHASIEMQARRNRSVSHGDSHAPTDLQADIQRANSISGHTSGSRLKKRFGSLRKRRD